MPHFYVFNTYGFGNESVQNNPQNQSNIMSQDTTASNASQTTGAIIDSAITLARNNGLHLSNRCKLSKRQLKAFNFISAHTLMNCTSTKARIEIWNNLPSDVRNNPNLITLAVKSCSYFAERRVVNLTPDAMTLKVQAYLKAKSIVMHDTVSNRSTTLFEFIGRNAQYIYLHHRYDCDSFMHFLREGTTVVDNVQVKHKFDVSTFKDQLMQSWDSVRNIAVHITRLENYRHGQRIAGNGLTEVPQSLREKLKGQYDIIASVRPMNWLHSLNPFQQRLSSRMRPDGACVGIELEFCASRGSEIVDWDEDDYPHYMFHSFKHDGSIGPANDNECCARYQEYTCFINADSDDCWRNVRNALKEITDNGALVNGSCGNHVHLDMRHKSQATYYRIAGRLRDAFTTWAHRLVSHRRAYNRYCGIQNEHHNNRYTAINTACWNEHRTLEVRIGMPTLNYNKLYQWTQFLRYLANNHNSIASFEEFMAGDAPLDVKLYALKRIARFEHTYINAGKGALAGFDIYKAKLDSISCIDHDFTSQSSQDIT